MLAITSRRPVGWLALAIVMALMAVATSLDAVGRAVHGEPLVLLPTAAWLPFCYWIGVGAWRRTTVDRE